MNIFEQIAGSVKGMMNYADKKEDVGTLKDLSHDDLMSTANKLKHENIALKERLIGIEKENGLLKQCVINSEEKDSSHFGRLFNSLKTTFLATDDEDFNEKNINDFKAFLYEQMLFFGGIEEDDITYLNQFINKTDEDWKTNKDVFLFKQTILERNYRELMNNMLVSPELNRMMNSKFNKERLNDFNNGGDNEEGQSSPFRGKAKEKSASPGEITGKETISNSKENKNNTQTMTSDNELNRPQIAKSKTIEATTPLKKEDKKKENTSNEQFKAKPYINTNSNKSSQMKKNDQKKDVLASLLFDNQDDMEEFD